MKAITLKIDDANAGWHFRSTTDNASMGCKIVAGTLRVLGKDFDQVQRNRGITLVSGTKRNKDAAYYTMNLGGIPC